MSAFFKSSLASVPSVGASAMPMLVLTMTSMAVEIVGRADGFGDAPRQPLRVGRAGDIGLDDGEFVAADAGDRVGVPHAAAQSSGHRPQQLVADRMSERIVDVLELIEIEAQHREPLAATSTWVRAPHRRSRSSTRFGRSVSASCRAMWAIFISARRRSVMSSWVATQPPPAMG
jgi:hypothetical protein